MLPWIKPARAVAAAFGLAALLAGCTVSSLEPLVGDADAVAPLPQQFAMVSYDEDNGVYTADDEDPQVMTLAGKAYVDAKNETAVRFVPIPGSRDYLVAVTGDDSTLYGLGEFENDVLAVYALIENSEEVEDIVARASQGADAATRSALAGLSVEDDGLVLTSRAALDLVIGWMRDGTLNMVPLVSHVTRGTEAKPPGRILRENGHWVTQD